MRQAVLIDGSNFYFKLKRLKLEQGKFDFGKFVEWLGGGKQIQCTYYVGAVRQEQSRKSQKLYAKQRAFLAGLRNQGIKVELGYILKGQSYHEKGVDVKIAIDLVVGAYENTYDKAPMISSDTDLIPAVEKAISKRKKVEYVGFVDQPSYAMKRYCSSTKLLGKKDLEKFIV